VTQPPPYPVGRQLLAGKRVLVTAAAGTGIGFATARRGAEEGAVVAISDRHERRLGESAQQLAEVMDSEPIAVPCDVTVEADVQRMFDTVGDFDVLVNNAGLGGTAPLADMTDEQWDAVVGVTLTGTMRCTREALRRFKANGHGGAIVNNASVIGWRAQEGQSHYAAAKAGVMALTRCAAVEAAVDGVRVNAVAPSLAMHENLAMYAHMGFVETHRATEHGHNRVFMRWDLV